MQYKNWYFRIAMLLSLAWASFTLAVQAPEQQYLVQPDFDSRMNRPPMPTPPSVISALNQLETSIGAELNARFHPFTGAVRQLSSSSGILSEPSRDAPDVVARRFLSDNRELFGLSANDLNTLVLVRNYSGNSEAITHLKFHQVINDIQVFEGVIGIHVNSKGQIVWVTNSAVSLGNIQVNPQLSAPAALLRAIADIRPEIRFQPQAIAGPEGADRLSVFAKGLLNKDSVVRLVHFPVRNGIRLAWLVSIEPIGFPQSYLVLVDATNGVIVHRRNLVNYADGVGNVLQSNATMADDPRRPDEHPAGSNPSNQSDPPNGCPPINNLNNRSLNSQFRQPASVLFNSGNLEGNNTSAFRETTGNFGAAGTEISGSLHFDFVFNTADFAETQLFFAVNFVHDFFYDLGFDEASGNFQEDNFGLGGIGGDSLNANARAPGRNNANFSTPSDGSNPTMNMFLWDGTGCWSEDVDSDGSQDLDGTIDSDIVIHEYHHGVTHRLNTTFSGAEAGAIGEGGGDFFAYSINGDTDLGEYAAPPNGIRQVNNKTYGNWFCFFGFICLVHDNGEIWANTLWDLRERFRGDSVGGSEAAAINELHQIYINGIKLSPASPTMLEMRDSMLQDDLNRNPEPSVPGGSSNYCRMWDEFAGRGMGENAQDTKDTGNNTVIEDFTVPAVCSGPVPTPDGDPSNLEATAISSSQIDLSWVDNSSDEDGFKIERCTGVGCSTFAEIAQVGSNVVSYPDTGLNADTTYRYRVRGFITDGGHSNYSNEDEATTLPLPSPDGDPSNLEATAISSSQIDLSWVDNSSDEDGFKIERCTGVGCSTFAEITQVGSNVESYNDTDLDADTTYRYRVRGFITGGGHSNYSNEDEATTLPLPPPAGLPQAPSNLLATPQCTGRGKNKVCSSIFLSWTDNSDNEDEFVIERCIETGRGNNKTCDFSLLATVSEGTTTYNDTTASSGNTYIHRIKARNAAGDSGYSNEVKNKL